MPLNKYSKRFLIAHKQPVKQGFLKWFIIRHDHSRDFKQNGAKYKLLFYKILFNLKLNKNNYFDEHNRPIRIQLQNPFSYLFFQ